MTKKKKGEIMKHFGYWVFGKDMYNVNLETLKKNGVTDIFLNYYSISLYGQAKVKDWIKKAKAQKINVHIWVQCFYNDGKWQNPKTTNLTSKLTEIKKYVAIEGVYGIHLDYLRYPGNAYKTSGGADAITAFVKKVKSQNPKTFLTCAVMPENEDDKKYYGQDIPALGKIVNAIIPMQYKGNYSSGSSWLASTTKYFSKYATVWSGLQTYKSDDDPTQLSAKEILSDVKTCISNGAKGTILFRYGICPTINFTSLQDKTTVALTANNIKSIATTVKKYINEKKKLPSSVTINGKKYTWPQIWYILAWAVNNLDKSLTTVPNVNKSTKATGTVINEKITPSDYKDQAKRILQYMKQNGKAPNYVTSVKSKTKIRPRVSIDALARAIVYYYLKNKLPTSLTFNSKRFTTTPAPTTECTGPRYTSSPHFLNQGSGYLGQTTPSRCGPHSIRQCLKKFGIDISEATLAGWAGTVEGSGTDHEGINTAIAMAAKKAGVEIDVTWYNFSSLGNTTAERFKKLGELFCQKNVAGFCHLWYSGEGDYIDDENACGHYEPLDRINLETKYVRALNSLGSRDGYGYYGHLQDRKFDVEAHYISGISQKSICILRKK